MGNKYEFMAGDRVVRTKEVIRMTGLSKSSLERMVEAGEFPAPFTLGARAKGWHEKAVLDWLNSRSKK